MKRIILPVLTVSVMGFIFFESSLPAESSAQQSSFIAKLFGDLVTPERIFWIRKAAHFTEFAVLGLLFGLLFERLALRQIESSSRRVLIRRMFAFFAGALYGVSDEIHQIFVFGRSCEVRDMGIDAMGVLFGVLIAHLILFLREKRRKTES